MSRGIIYVLPWDVGGPPFLAHGAEEFDGPRRVRFRRGLLPLRVAGVERMSSFRYPWNTPDTFETVFATWRLVRRSMLRLMTARSRRGERVSTLGAKQY
eukprot:10313071-Alexandrium_andersonii.AAC.1